LNSRRPNPTRRTPASARHGLFQDFLCHWFVKTGGMP
jgi:hypothetical protein